MSDSYRPPLPEDVNSGSSDEPTPTYLEMVTPETQGLMEEEEETSGDQLRPEPVSFGHLMAETRAKDNLQQIKRSQLFHIFRFFNLKDPLESMSWAART